MSSWLHSAGSVAIAAFVGLTLGLALGRYGSTRSGGRTLVSVLTGLRGALFPFLIVVLATARGALADWVAIGLVVGFGQATAIARFIVRPNADWSSSVVGGVALGVSGGAQISRESTRRGAVSASLALVFLPVLLVEATLELLAGPASRPARSLGSWLVRSDVTTTCLVGLVLFLLALSLEEATQRWLVGGFRDLRRR